MFKEFREFALRGNVVDLPVAVIIGAAFGKIADWVVGEAFMPVIGATTGKVNAKSRPRGPPSAATPGGTPHGIRDVLKRTVEGSGAPVQCSKRREEV
jgi:hypothetical protein